MASKRLTLELTPGQIKAIKVATGVEVQKLSLVPPTGMPNRTALRGTPVQKAALRASAVEKAALRGTPVEKAALRGTPIQKAALRGTAIEKAALRTPNLPRATLAPIDGEGVTGLYGKYANIIFEASK